MKTICVTAALIAVLAAVPAVAQVDLPNNDKPWVHSQTGAIFPVVSGSFKRATIQRFDETGDDVGVTYHLIEAGKPTGISAIYIYPAGPDTCAATWEGTKGASNRGGDTVLGEDRAPSPSGATPAAAYHANRKMSFETPSNPITATMYLYCVPGGKWLVKYYASWKGTGDRDAETVALLRSVTWPEDFSH